MCYLDAVDGLGVFKHFLGQHGYALVEVVFDLFFESGVLIY